ncbi:MAG: glycosyltransferase [Candidatus Helarchaeota archaeon]
MNDTEKPFVSIVLAVRNEEDTIKKCIEAILNQDYPHNCYEILVIDGLSEDDTQNIVLDLIKKNKDRIKLLMNQEKSAAFGRNIGILESKGEYVGILHGRGIVNKNWISNLTQILMQGDETIAAAGCIALTANKTAITEAEEVVLSSSFGGFRTATSKIISKEKKPQIFEAESIGVSLYKKSILLKVGLYDEKLFSGEDFELNYRIRKAGYKILGSTSAIINYYRRTTLGSFKSRLYNFGQGRACIIKKHRDSFKFFYLIPSFFAIFVIIFGLFNLLTLILNVFFNYYLFKFFQLFSFTLDTVFQLFYILVIVIYFLIVFIYAVISYKKFKNKRGILVLFAIFPIQHLAFGLGFIRGLFPYRKIKITR